LVHVSDLIRPVPVVIAQSHRAIPVNDHVCKWLQAGHPAGEAFALVQ